VSPYDERCPECGFRWSQVALDDVPDRVRGAVEELIATLAAIGPRVGERSRPSRWSPLEYGGHVRDVLLTLRERVLLACASPDIEVASNSYRDERVDQGFYGRDTIDSVTGELRVAAALFGRTLQCVAPERAGRTLIFPLRDDPVTVTWMGAQAVHECEHHLADVRGDLAQSMA
jgi:hypothetical protein